MSIKVGLYPQKLSLIGNKINEYKSRKGSKSTKQELKSQI